MAFPSVDAGLRIIDLGTLANAITAENELFTMAKQTASGTNQATAFPIISSNVCIFEVTTTPSGSGVALPISDPGDRYLIANNGLNTLTVYTNTLETAASPKINGTLGSTGVTQASGTNALYVCMTAGQFYRISGT